MIFCAVFVSSKEFTLNRKANVEKYEDIHAKCLKIHFHSDSLVTCWCHSWTTLFVAVITFSAPSQQLSSIKFYFVLQNVMWKVIDNKSSCNESFRWMETSVTKDDHFPVVILKLHFKSTWIGKKSFPNELISFSTMMLLLNRHLTQYKWYFVSFSAHGGVWFVCDKCNWLCGCFFSSSAKCHKRLLKMRIFIERVDLCVQKIFAFVHEIHLISRFLSSAWSFIAEQQKSHSSDCYQNNRFLII